MLIPADSTSLLIQWMPPAVPNGIIKNYNLVINYSNSTNLTTRSVDSGSTLYLLSNLNVYQLVGISISATTGGGEGPMSSYVFNRSGETGYSISSWKLLKKYCIIYGIIVSYTRT